MQATECATWRSRPTANSCLRPPRLIRHTRHSPSSLYRPSMWQRWARSWRRGVGAHPPSLRSGLHITQSLKARRWASRRSKLIELVSSAVGATFTHPSRCWTGGVCQTPWVQYLIRCSRSGIACAYRRPSPDRIRRGAGGPAALWTHGISGDLPIVLLRIADVEDIAIARQLLRAHEYWRMKRLAVDLVILNERTSYLQDLQMALETQLRMSQSQPQISADNARGSVFLL